MSITAIFANSPFDKEVRIDCKILKMNTDKDGEICILPNFNNSIFEIKDNVIEVECDNTIKKIKIIGTGIVKFENNTFICLGSFKKI